MATTKMVRDRDWVRQCFLVVDAQLEDQERKNRYFSSASLKFTDTSPGGNLCINPPPQFTRFADIKARDLLAEGVLNQKPSPASVTDTGISRTMGRYYSEAIDDNNQIIHMRFGVPSFNSLTTFFAGFYNTEAGVLARTGRSVSIFFKFGKLVGSIVPLLNFKLLLVTAVGYGLRFAFNKPASKFYYLKPAMPLYWHAVQTMVNHIAVNKGIVPRAFGDDTKDFSAGYEFPDDQKKLLHKNMPDVFDENANINVFAIANKAQRLARRREAEILKAMDEQSVDKNAQEILVRLQMNPKGLKNMDVNRPAGTPKTGGGLFDYVKDWITNTWGDYRESVIVEPDARAPGTGNQAPETRADQYFRAELDDGGAFVSFRVNATGPTSESFSNSVTDSQIGQKINSAASEARESKFSFAGGNLAADDALFGLMGVAKKAMTAATDTVAGLAAGVGLSGLAVFHGGAFVDFPKHWESSSSQLPRMSYTVELKSWAGNPISQLLHIYMPLCMLLAGVLPLATGRQSYTSPFIVELFDKGHAQSRLALMESLSITRGTGNTGFNSAYEALGIEVQFNLVDLTSLMYMPIVEGFTMSATQMGFNAGSAIGVVTPGVEASEVGDQVAQITGAIDDARNLIRGVQSVFDDDTIFSDYMAVLSAMGLKDQIYQFRKMKLNLTKAITQWKTFHSPATYASFMGDTISGNIMSAWYRGAAK